MVRPAVAVAVALTFVLSGCVGAAAPGTMGGAWSGDPDNHWQEPVIEVSVQAPNGNDRDYGPLLHRALVYWTEYSEQYAGYDVGLRRADPGEDADVRVQFVDAIEDCGATRGEHTAGCAPVLTGPHQVDRPVDVAVRTGLSAPSTVRVLKHELGHALGVSHGETPDGVMDARMDLSTVPRPNATDRANPWPSDDVAVHVAGSAAEEDRTAVERQIDAAIEYYANGAGGAVPSNVTFSRVESPEEATVVVRLVESDACRSGPGSCGVVTGDDLDGDGAVEYHDRLEIVLVDPSEDADAVAWHVGRWLGVGYGLEDGEYPAALSRNASYADRRIDWWR